MRHLEEIPLRWPYGQRIIEVIGVTALPRAVTSVTISWSSATPAGCLLVCFDAPLHDLPPDDLATHTKHLPVPTMLDSLFEGESAFGGWYEQTQLLMRWIFAWPQDSEINPILEWHDAACFTLRPSDELYGSRVLTRLWYEAFMPQFVDHIRQIFGEAVEIELDELGRDPHPRH